jgi:hypothetical protein
MAKGFVKGQSAPWGAPDTGQPRPGGSGGHPSNEPIWLGDRRADHLSRERRRDAPAAGALSIRRRILTGLASRTYDTSKERWEMLTNAAQKTLVVAKVMP